MPNRPKPWKSVETKHHEERDEFFRGLAKLPRRSFFRLAGLSAAYAAAHGLVTPHGFQLVEVAGAQERGGTGNTGGSGGSGKGFTFAYISDTHLYPQKLNDRFVRAILRAVDDVNALDP